MEWYGGGIAEAVTLSRKKGSIFVVYIEGSDDKSKRLTELIDTKEVSEVLGGESFVAIKVEANSVPHQQFSEIYKQTPIPSLYFIGKSGTPLEIITELNDSADALGKISGVLVKNGGTALKTDTENLIKSEAASTAQPTVVPKETAATKEEPSTSAGGTSIAQKKEEENVAEATNAVAPATVTAASNELSTEDKLRIAQDLIVKKRALKKAEEEENEKQKEVERRKLGQDVQKMKRWQQEQELKQMMEEREKEKREQIEARERIRRQIEEDKREKAVRFATPPPAQPQVVDQQPRTAPRSADSARLQFRLPDGTSHTHDFASSARLDEVVDFVRANLRLPYAKFVLSTTFPRREFNDADSSSTLSELQLVPNAVVLVLPATAAGHGGGAVTPASAGQGLTGMLWYILAPILNFLGYLKGFFVGGGGGNAGGSTAASKAPKAQRDNKRSSSDSQNTTDTSKPLPKRRAGEAAIRRQGNIHRLTDRDSDDDNNTWNGNSTQQM